MKSIFLGLIMVTTLKSCLLANQPVPLQTRLEEINKKIDKAYSMHDDAAVVAFYDSSFYISAGVPARHR